MPCHQIRQLFPNGEINRRRRGHALITKTMIQIQDLHFHAS
jgi:hypothetical protein